MVVVLLFLLELKRLTRLYRIKNVEKDILDTLGHEEVRIMIIFHKKK